MTEDLYIRRAVYLGNFTLLIESEEGETRILDCSSWLQKNMGAFESLKKEENFKQFYIDTGILTWHVDIPKKNDKQINEFDIAPEYVYENSIPVILHKGENRITINQQA